MVEIFRSSGIIRSRQNRGEYRVGVHVVLYQPEIPANTGNIARTCAATGTELHLIRPLGFSTDDKMLKRAGLDYWQHVKITYYDSIEEFYEKIKMVNSSI